MKKSFVLILILMIVQMVPAYGMVEKKPDTKKDSISTSSDSTNTAKKGDSGMLVREIQWKLVNLGYLSGKPDGIFGKQTEAAVKKFQQDNGLNVTGYIAKEDYNVLYGQSAIKNGVDVVENKDTIRTNEDAKNSGDTVKTILERQDKYNNHYKYAANTRIKEYWEVSITDFVLSCEEYEDAVKIITIHMRWDVQNGVEQTKKMLSMYSDDMAAYLRESNKDVPINNICIIWEDSYILEYGPVAKYEYYGSGEKMIHSRTSGYLYDR